MFIFKSNPDGTALLYIPPYAGWFLATDTDIQGNVDLFFYPGASGDPVLMCSGTELRNLYPALKSEMIADFFNAVIREAMHRISVCTVPCIDLVSIQEALLPSFLEKWKTDGLLNG